MLYSHDKQTGDGDENMMLLEFAFNAQRGTLSSRSNSLFEGQEDFSYDDLDRLTGFTDNNGSREQSYDNRGRITHNPGIGDYTYSNTHPYQANQVELTLQGHDYYHARGQQSLSYNAFKKLVSIHVEGRERIDFSYNPFKGRTAMFYGSNAEDITERPLQKYYSSDGSMEIKNNSTTGQTQFICYIGGDAYSAPVILKSDGETSAFLYLHRDYLGSIIAITNQEGQLLEKRHFDAWGNIVNLQDGQGTDLDVLTVFDRGYTGHEHLQGVELIHMNGRLYDPLLHRFLAPDNYVQNPYNTQNFNRYGYVLNNPLSYTDPSGEFIIEAMLIGAVVNTLMQSMSGNLNTAGDLFMAMGVGAISGAAGYGAGQWVAGAVGTIGFTSGALTGAASGLVSGFVGGAGNAWGMQGSSFGQGLRDGLIGGGFGAVAGGLIGGTSGGISAVKHGGNFWSGKGATFDTFAMSGIANGESQEYSTRYAKGFSDEYFGQIKGLNKLYADGSIPTGYTKEGNVVFNSNGKRVAGTTRYLGKRSSDVYLYKSAFASKEKLYLTMGHEYLHVSYNYAGIGSTSALRKAKHASIRQWQFEQARAWNYSATRLYENKYMELKSFLNPKYHYSKFGFSVFDVKLW